VRENRLLSLLLQISETLVKNGPIQTQEELPKMFCHTLNAKQCAVYLLKDSNYFLTQHYSASTPFHFPYVVQQSGLTLSASAQYIDCQEKSDRLSLLNDWSRCMLLPFLRKEKIIAGVFLVGWNLVSELDSMCYEEQRTLQAISQLLTEIYCVFPLIDSLSQREQFLMALYQKTEQEIEKSRREVSMALHDEVGQVLTSILLQLNLLQQSDDLNYVKGRLGGLHHITLQTLNEVRRISHNLRPALLERLGLQAALEAHIKEYTDSTNIEVEFRSHNLEERIPSYAENIVYRAVQEGLTNVARHAKASSVFIHLSKKCNNLLLQISDNGLGMKKTQSYGLGLLGMEERVKMAKGKFWLLQREGQGLSINILLPLV